MNGTTREKRTFFFCIILVLFFIYENSFAAGQSSTSYLISEDVMSGAGGTIESVSYTIQSTLGQPSAIGDGVSLTYYNHAGFWHFLVRLGDLNGDGFVDLEDVISGLQVMTDMDAGQLYKEADVDGDGKIGMAEIVYILQKVGRVR